MLDFAINPVRLQDNQFVPDMSNGGTPPASTIFGSAIETRKAADSNPIVPDPGLFYLDKTALDGNNPLGGSMGVETVDHNVPIDAVYGTDTSTKFSRTIDIPTVLDLKTTDKASGGVYEAPAPERAASTPVDATLMNNPVVENLENFRTDNHSSPLGANFAGYSVVGSGQDPQSFYNNTTPQQPATDQTAAPDTTTVTPDTSSQNWFDWLTTTAGGKSIKGEITILLVGVVVLAIGIIALTRE